MNNINLQIKFIDLIKYFADKNILINSKISAFLVNKEASFNPTDDSYSVDLNHFNRVFGFETKIKSKDTRWNSELYYHQSLDNQKMEIERFGTAALPFYVVLNTENTYNKMLGLINQIKK